MQWKVTFYCLDKWVHLIALDRNLRSIGVNFGSKRPVVGIRLRRSPRSIRVKPENLSLWISDNNQVYNQYTGRMSFSNETQALILDHLDFSCQYWKIHCDFKDYKYTFSWMDIETMIETYGPPDFSQIQ
jgi:hypothetical protein